MLVAEEKYIEHDFNLPNHTTQLSKADEIIENLKNKLKKLQQTKSITDATHIGLYEEIVRVLDYVGKLSMSAFAIEEDLEALYVLKYRVGCPELRKKLFNDHYESIHRPYTLRKNRCFRMLEELDAMYEKKWKKKPPNWNL